METRRLHPFEALTKTLKWRMELKNGGAPLVADEIGCGADDRGQVKGGGLCLCDRFIICTDVTQQYSVDLEVISAMPMLVARGADRAVGGARTPSARTPSESYTPYTPSDAEGGGEEPESFIQPPSPRNVPQALSLCMRLSQSLNICVGVWMR